MGHGHEVETSGIDLTDLRRDTFQIERINLDSKYCNLRLNRISPTIESQTVSRDRGSFTSY